MHYIKNITHIKVTKFEEDIKQMQIVNTIRQNKIMFMKIQLFEVFGVRDTFHLKLIFGR